MGALNGFRLVAIGVAMVALLGSTRSQAQVLQLDGTPLPQPVPGAEVRLSADLGWDAEQQLWTDFDGNPLNPPLLYGELFPSFETGDAVTLEGLFKWRDDPVDPASDATTEPGAY